MVGVDFIEILSLLLIFIYGDHMGAFIKTGKRSNVLWMVIIIFILLGLGLGFPEIQASYTLATLILACTMLSMGILIGYKMEE